MKCEDNRSSEQLEYPGEIEAGERALRLRVKFLWGRILERDNLLCPGYVWNLDHRRRQFLMSWLRVKIKAKGTGVRSILSWSLDHRTRQFPVSWLPVFW